FGYQNPPRNSPRCGQCIRVFVGTKSVYVKVVDKCEACKSGDVDVSPVAFKLLADPALGRVNSRWEVASQSQCSSNNGGSNSPVPPNSIAVSISSTSTFALPTSTVTPTYSTASSNPPASTYQTNPMAPNSNSLLSNLHLHSQSQRVQPLIVIYPIFLTIFYVFSFFILN
ncbi:hypothetical protein HMI56_003364, partial [Coelomomyces lativittatus]